MRSGRVSRRFLFVVLSGYALVFLMACAPASIGDNDSLSATVTPLVGPLDQIWLRILGDTPNATIEQRQARAIANERIQEELIAACMSEHGFVYYPMIRNITVVFPDGIASEQRQWIEEFGFGQSTSPEDSNIYEGGALRFELTQDPNQELRDSMSAAELAAWENALWGNITDNQATSTSCFATANRVMSGSLDEFTALRNEIGIFRDSVLQGNFPEIIALNSEWATCMASNGFPQLRSPFHARETITREWEDLHGMTTEITDEGVVWTHAGTRIATPEELRLFSAREISIALATYDCQIETDYEARLSQIDFELQRQFVEQHAAELEAWAYHAEHRRANLYRIEIG